MAGFALKIIVAMIVEACEGEGGLDIFVARWIELKI